MTCGKEKDALYEKEDFTDEDGIRASELEEEFAELGGWEAESDASRILQGLGIPTEYHYELMADMDGRAQGEGAAGPGAVRQSGHPACWTSRPTTWTSTPSTGWRISCWTLTARVIVVSHDRHFLNTVCTHIVDIDYSKIKMYVGNYDFWYESSQLVQNLIKQPEQAQRGEDQGAAEPSSPASPPTSPRASRPRPAASCWTS